MNNDIEWVDTPQSSNILGYGYDAADNILTVLFKGGMRYRYRDVPRAVFDEFKTAKSPGVYLARRVKGAYEFERVYGGLK